MPDRFARTLLPEAALLALWGPDTPEFQVAAAALLGDRLPAAIGEARGDADQHLLRLGPGEWLLLRPDGDAAALAAAWDAPLAEAGGVATDVSDGWARLRLEGTAVRRLLGAGLGLDLDPRHFGPGRCARTLLARCPVLLIPGAGTAMDLLVARSFAAWLVAWLDDAALGLG